MRRRLRFPMRTLFVLIMSCGGAAYGSRNHVIAFWDNWTKTAPNFSSEAVIRSMQEVAAGVV